MSDSEPTSTTGSQPSPASQPGDTFNPEPTESSNAWMTPTAVLGSGVIVTEVVPREAPAGPTTPANPNQGPDADLGVPVGVEPGKVVIRLSAASYTTKETISATIANGLDRTLYTEDSKSDCSIAILERRNGADWQPLVGCALGRMPLVVVIGAGRGRVVTINPRSEHFAGISGTLEPGIGAGTYRIKFTYQLAPEAEAGESQVAYSPVFDIRP